MKIKYSEHEKSILIADNLAFRYFLLYATSILTIANSIIFSINTILNHQEISWIWIAVGIFSLTGLIYTISKKTIIKKIPIQNIMGLKQRNIFGQSRYSLKLKNGKLRDSTALKTRSEKQELVKLFDQIGVKTTL